MDLIKKPDGDLGHFQAGCLTAGWMSGWAFAWFVSEHSTLSFNQMMGITYGGLTALVVLLTWEHLTYWKSILRINELMHQ
jgi:hypothetical protein